MVKNNNHTKNNTDEYLLSCMYIISFNLKKHPHEVRIIIIHILQVRKLRLEEIK